MLQVEGSIRAHEYEGSEYQQDQFGNCHSLGSGQIECNSPFDTVLSVGDEVFVDAGNQTRYITSIDTATTATVDSDWTLTFSDGTFVTFTKSPLKAGSLLVSNSGNVTVDGSVCAGGPFQAGTVTAHGNPGYQAMMAQCATVESSRVGFGFGWTGGGNTPGFIVITNTAGETRYLYIVGNTLTVSSSVPVGE
jgi:hypothetical protein